ncbi:hypothetical protein V1478_017278 [Vespula squamosa]|uniref:Uncharacterized protein n=1 Tax=Vespula squamosa TaxID=30214 RepID=A0ABD1ZXJ0_VESSQ
MDALELQAALVKLDPATTVTPITSNVKLMSHHRIAFAVDVDDDDLTLRNSSEVDEKQSSGGCSNEHQQSSSTTTGTGTTTGTRKLQNANCGASLTVTTHQNHQTGQQQMGMSKCNLVEVR